MSFAFILDVCTWAAPIVLLIGIATGTLLYSLLDPIHRVLLVYCVTALLTDLTSRVFGELYNNNLFLIPLFGLAELGLFAVLYYKYLLGSQSKVLLLCLLSGLGFIAFETIAVYALDPGSFQSYSRVVDPFFIVLLSVLYFRKLGQEEIIHTELLQLNTVILLFFSLNLIFFLPVNFLINEHSPLKFWFWLANLVLTLCFYSFLIRSIWKRGKTRRHLHYGS